MQNFMEQIHYYGNGYVAYYVGVSGSTYYREGILHNIHWYELHKYGVIYKTYSTCQPTRSVSSFDRVKEDKLVIEIFKNFV